MNSKQLKETRNNAGFTQNELALKLGMSTKSYNRKELGIIEFSRSEILSIITILNLSIKEVDSIFFDNMLPKGN